MSDTFQRLLLFSGHEALSLNAQAALDACEPERSQFAHLVRHFLERFFNHETASPDGDAKARLVLTAFTVSLPPFVIALYLWPVYHPFLGWPPGRASNGGPPPYWLQVNHHLFYVVYSFVAMGIVTVFEWDLFFPDLLDIFVLQTLPIPKARVFLARVTAIAIFIAGFLFDANLLAPIVLPAAIDPPNLVRFLGGHLLAVACSGLFATVFILALQGLLLSLLGERMFRRLSLLLQGLMIAALLMMLLVFPVLSGAVPVLLQSHSFVSLCIPPLWFLGIYQRVMEGPTALPIYSQLAQIGCVALPVAAGMTMLVYPLAYLRRVHQLVEGPGARARRNWLSWPFDRLIHFAVVRNSASRAVFHFISQTILRVPRYRIYLVLYGSVGISVVAASILRLSVEQQEIRIGVSPDGIRVAIGIIAFWMIAGLRMAFVSPGNQQGRWIFRTVNGRPPHFVCAVEQFVGAEAWILLWALLVTCGASLAFRAFAPPALLTWPATASQLLIAVGMCLLITDFLFLHQTSIPFTGEIARDQTNPAISVLKYIAFVPVVAWIPLMAEPWIEGRMRNFAVAIGAITAIHLMLRYRHRRIVREYCGMPGLEDDEEDFPMKLGLRY